MNYDPTFWAIASIAVLIIGISKGGFGGIALIATPLLTLVIPPIQAVAILLPVLIAMDIISAWSYRDSWDKKVLTMTVPGALIGILLGATLAGFVSDKTVLICVGIIATIFPIHAYTKRKSLRNNAKNNMPLGMIAGTVSGFSSFIAHAGAPPFQAYAIPQGMEKRIFAGTSVMFYFIINMVKVIPYAALGQFDASSLKISLFLIPISALGVLLGIWLIKYINQALFFRIIYIIIFCVGLRLLWQGFVG